MGKATYHPQVMLHVECGVIHERWHVKEYGVQVQENKHKYKDHTERDLNAERATCSLQR